MGTTPRPSTLPCFLLSMGALSLFLAGFWGLQGLGSGEGSLDAAAQGGSHGILPKGPGRGQERGEPTGWRPWATYGEGFPWAPPLCWAGWGLEEEDSVTINLLP